MEFAFKLSFRRNVTEARFSKLYLILAISKGAAIRLLKNNQQLWESPPRWQKTS